MAAEAGLTLISHFSALTYLIFAALAHMAEGCLGCLHGLCLPPWSLQHCGLRVSRLPTQQMKALKAGVPREPDIC